MSEHEKPRRSTERARSERVGMVAAILSAFSAVASLYFAWWAASVSLEVFRRSEAPYLNLDRVDCDAQPAIDVNTRIMPVLKNTGRRSAEGLQGNWWTDVVGVKAIPGGDTEDVKAIGAFSEVRLGGVTISDALANQESMWKGVQAGSVRFGLKGNYTYRDEFGNSHQVIFAGRFYPGSPCGFVATENSDIVSHSAGFWHPWR